MVTIQGIDQANFRNQAIINPCIEAYILPRVTAAAKFQAIPPPSNRTNSGAGALGSNN